MLLEEIKSRTSHLHEQVEADLEILGECFTLGDYRQLLGRFYGFVEPWEPRLREALGGEAALFEGREKRVRLERDLQFLGMNEGDLRALPRCGDLPKLDSVASALGSMYVFEGATLGGQILWRHFQDKFGLTGGGCHFFGSYGVDVGRMWKLFRGILVEHSSPEADPVIVGSAVATFESLARWLEGRRR